ncbi:MAG: class C beta-lactamase-related serine hydrolase [Alphaproteobacteria bacterium]|nr:MAG: class C beta-lactamase-related serine hydrolase [Alphaproteobacteria bacterium]
MRFFSGPGGIRKAVYTLLAVAISIGIFAGIRHLLAISHVASAYYAKTLCSGLFVSRRPQQEVITQDVLADLPTHLKHFSATVDHTRNLVRSSLFGMVEHQALYRPGLGCTLVNGTSIEALRAQAHGFTPLRTLPQPGALWPEGDRVDLDAPMAGVDKGVLQRVVDAAFAEPREETARRTRAVIVVHKGRIIAERYAPGFTPATPQLGWSMGKTVTAMLAGILAGQGRLKPDQAGLFPEWSGAGDPRAAISVDHLLRMTSGLDFDQPHERMLSDVRKMLFLEPDAAGYAKVRELAAPPGSFWRYGSGPSVLLNALLRTRIDGGQAAYFNFPYRALFAPLGMSTVVVEPDPSGTYLMPAFIHAGARDWARLGLFLLRDGVWQGKRILPEGWVAYLLRPTPQSRGYFGAHLWRRVPDFLRPYFAGDFTLPASRFYMLGHDGQMVAMVPSHDLVVVRLGLSRRHGAWDPDAFLDALLTAFPALDAGRRSRSGVEPAVEPIYRRPGFSWGRGDQPER